MNVRLRTHDILAFLVVLGWLWNLKVVKIMVIYDSGERFMELREFRLRATPL